ncbi:MAG: hypothetical protein KDD67_05400 [Ignavibacteriae bacterium]|nr:hypothetical protein [Ignavibacteriota bacterium]MCB9216239.1 hypothetical protein [Ignavibacteria bacterium]
MERRDVIASTPRLIGGIERYSLSYPMSAVKIVLRKKKNKDGLCRYGRFDTLL